MGCAGLEKGALIVGKKEQFALQNWASHSPAKLVPAEEWFGSSPGEIVMCVRSFIPQILKSSPVEFIASGFGRHIHHRASGKTELGVIFPGIDLHFLHAFDRRSNADVCILGFTVRNSFDIDRIRIGVDPADGG